MASAASSQPQPAHGIVIPLKPRSQRGYSEAVIARTIEDLCEMGLVEAFCDEHNIVRYRPTGGRIA